MSKEDLELYNKIRYCLDTRKIYTLLGKKSSKTLHQNCLKMITAQPQKLISSTMIHHPYWDQNHEYVYCHQKICLYLQLEHLRPVEYVFWCSFPGKRVVDPMIPHIFAQSTWYTVIDIMILIKKSNLWFVIVFCSIHLVYGGWYEDNFRVVYAHMLCQWVGDCTYFVDSNCITTSSLLFKRYRPGTAVVNAKHTQTT